MTLLIADDNPQMRRLTRSMIHDLAGDIYECDDGGEAVECYRAHRPDWVLMDVRMKQVDGITATREIKADFPEAKIVIVTNYDDPDLIELAMLAGATAYVTKAKLSDLRHILIKNGAAPNSKN